MPTHRLRQLLSDSFVYGLGGILSKGITFLLVPIYTCILSPADYGIMELMITAVAILSSLTQGGMDSAQSYFFFKKEASSLDQKRLLISSIVKLRLLWTGVVLVLAAVPAVWLTHSLQGRTFNANFVLVAVAGILTTQMADQATELFRLRFRPVPYVLVLACQTALASGFAVLLMVHFQTGVIGYFWGILFGSTVAAVLSWSAHRQYWHLKTDPQEWTRPLIRFGIPLIPVSLGLLLVTTLDRWFLLRWAGPAEVGKYAVCAKVAALLTFIATIFRQSWWPNAMQAIQQPDAAHLFRTIARLYAYVSISLVLLLTAFAPVLIRVISPAPYWDAFPIIGVLAWQAVFFGFYLIASIGIWKSEKTHYTAWILAGSLCLNVLLLAWLVPAFGALGAATATAIVFLVWNGLTVYVSERLWPVRYNFGELLGLLSYGVASTAITTVLYIQHFTLAGQGVAACSGLALGCLAIYHTRAAVRNPFVF